MFIAFSLYPEGSLVVPSWVIYTSAVMLGLAVVFSLMRFFIGPRTPDRIVAFDLLAGLTLAALLLSGIASGSEFYLQAVLGFSLVLFLGTVALSRYLDRPGGNDGKK
jgi:multicomponent Na+:H+ antiporter subunit F